jgi:hypothetical protein
MGASTEGKGRETGLSLKTVIAIARYGHEISGKMKRSQIAKT